MNIKPKKIDPIYAAYVLGYIDSEDNIPNRATEEYADELRRESYNTGYRTAERGFPINQPHYLS